MKEMNQLWQNEYGTNFRSISKADLYMRVKQRLRIDRTFA